MPDFIESAQVNPRSAKVQSMDHHCPKCGHPTETGHGLAFGGYGFYECCTANCGWFFKCVEDGE